MIQKHKKDIGMCVGIIVLVLVIVLIEVMYFFSIVKEFKTNVNREPNAEENNNVVPH